MESVKPSRNKSDDRRNHDQEEGQSYHLTKEEAFEFVEDILKICNIDKKLQESRLDFLNSLIYAMYQNIPFQTVYRTSVPLTDRKRLTFSMIKQHMFKTYGGTCQVIQPFFKCLLDALGYKTDFCPATVSGAFEGHVCVVVHDLGFEGSKHIAEVSNIHPMFKAIPLNFERESPTYSSSYFKFKYVRTADGHLDWLRQSSTDIDQWSECASLNVSKLVDISYFFKNDEDYFKDPSIYLNRSVWASHYNGNCLVSVRGNKVFWSDGLHQTLYSKDVGTREELKAIISKEFPQLPTEMIEKALLNTESLRD